MQDPCSCGIFIYMWWMYWIIILWNVRYYVVKLKIVYTELLPTIQIIVRLFENSMVWFFIYIFIPWFSFIFCLFPICLMPMSKLVQGFKYLSICCVCEISINVFRNDGWCRWWLSCLLDCCSIFGSCWLHRGSFYPYTLTLRRIGDYGCYLGWLLVITDLSVFRIDRGK